MNRRRILIVTTSYLPLIGGSELAIKEITRRLPEFDFDLITSMPDLPAPRQERMGNVNVFRVGSHFHRLRLLMPKTLLPLAVFWKILSLHRKNKYTLIHAFQASAAAGGAWLAKLFIPSLPLILTLQEGEQLNRQPLLTRFFRKLIISKPDYFTAISSYLADYVKSIRGNAEVKVIPNGVDLSAFDGVSESRRLVREELNIPSDYAAIITVSRLVVKNGVENLIRAFAEAGANLILVIVGDGPLDAHLKKLAGDLGVADRVRWLGKVIPDRIPEYLSGADMFVRPSQSEGLGNAFLEALAAGVPIVGPLVGGIPDFLKDGENGLVCDPKNPTDIADKIKRLTNDKETRSRLGLAGRQMVRARYDWDNIARSVAEVYNHIAP